MKFWLSALTILFSASLVSAAVKSFSVSSNTASATDTSDSTKYKIFGGLTTSSACTGTTEVCDSCATLTSVAANTQCNNRSIWNSLPLTIQMVFDSVPTTEFKVFVGTDDVTSSITRTPTAITVGATVSIEIPWSVLCDKIGGNANCNGLSGFNGSEDLKIGFATSAGSEVDSAQGKTFTVFLRVPAASLASNTTGYHTTSCAYGATPGTAATGEGFCNFTVSPGDQKVYLLDLKRGSVNPADGTAVRYSALRVYYASSSLFTAISPASSYKDLSIKDKSSVTSELNGNKVDSLQNETTYRFLIATVDEAQNVTYFSDPSALTDNLHSATPGEVVGLLDGKKCFVATAAYGSEMADEVELLRRFRSEVLLKNRLGKFFVSWYYKTSPPAAQFIAQHEWLRTLTRGVLWPAIALIELFYSGYLSWVLIFGIASLVFVKTKRRSWS